MEHELEYLTSDDYGMTPAQLHRGLDKLWAALGLTTVQDQDVFTLAAERINALAAEVEGLNRSLVHGEF